jgi:chromosome condensin MukBEF ATPase and DNA-binding subunit MukB
MEREIGALQARMETVEHELQAIRSDVREIRDALVTARGGWTTLTLMVGVSVSFGTLLGKFLPQLLSMTR